jgi:hypothetical protein
VSGAKATVLNVAVSSLWLLWISVNKTSTTKKFVLDAPRIKVPEAIQAGNPPVISLFYRRSQFDSAGSSYARSYGSFAGSG